MSNIKCLNYEEVDLTNEEYHSLHEYVSSTTVKTIAKKGYWHYQAELKLQREPSPDLIFGSAFHHWMLERDSFYDYYAVEKKVDGRTKEGKEYKAQFRQLSEGKQVINELDMQIINNMEEAFMDWCDANPDIAAEYFDENSKSEVSYLGEYTDDQYQKTKVRVRFDRFNLDSKTGFDLKSCRDIAKFKSDSYNLKYDLQDVHYRLIADDFIFIAIEKTAPYNVQAFRISKERRQYAEAEWLEVIETWNSYKDEPVIIRPSGVLEI